MASSHDVVSHPYAQSLIRIKARQLCRRADFSWSDLKDLQQDMRVYLLQKAHLFNPQRGTSLTTFIAHAIDSWVAMLLRDRQRDKRRAGIDAISLNGDAPKGNDGASAKSTGKRTSLSGNLTEADGHRRLGSTPGDLAESLDRTDAFDFVIKRLSNKQKALLALVIQHGKKGAADRLGVSRRQIDKALAAMRPLFERAGFGFD